MDLTGETLIAASRDVVWQGLNDPEILRQAIPGCESLEKTSEISFTARVVAKIGPVRAPFSGVVKLSDILPQHSYRISGEGHGGVAGFAKGAAFVRLEDAPGGTLLSYAVEAQIGGKLAQLGSRLVDSTAKALARDFFSRFSTVIGAQTPDHPAAEDIAALIADGEIPPPPPGTGPSPEADEAVAMDAVVAQSRGLPPWIWIGSVVALMALILALAIQR